MTRKPILRPAFGRLAVWKYQSFCKYTNQHYLRVIATSRPLRNGRGDCRKIYCVVCLPPNGHSRHHPSPLPFLYRPSQGASQHKGPQYRDNSNREALDRNLEDFARTSAHIPRPKPRSRSALVQTCRCSPCVLSRGPFGIATERIVIKDRSSYTVRLGDSV